MHFMKKTLITLLTVLHISNLAWGQTDTLSVYFDSGEYQLNSAQTSAIKACVDRIKPELIDTVIISAYADYVGSSDSNLLLSNRRADAVKMCLISQHQSIEPLITAKGFGELSQCIETQKGCRESRRVDIVCNFSPSQEVKAIDSTESDDNNLNTAFQDTKIGSSLQIKNLSFEGGRHYLLESSRPTLYELLRILKDNEQLEIEIRGHICCQDVGDGYDINTQTRNLSETRAQYIYLFLIDHGIDAKRLRFKGMGSSQRIVVPELTDEDRSTNRRVEIVILNK